MLGAGKSQFLKTIGGHMRNNKLVKGTLLYDGLSSAEQLQHNGIFTEKLCALVAQGDVHFANLTVRETLLFTFRNTVVPLLPELFNQSGQLDPKLLEYHEKRVDLLIAVLGLVPIHFFFIHSFMIVACNNSLFLFCFLFCSV